MRRCDITVTTKKYFIKPLGGGVKEVTQGEYAGLANQQFMASDAKTMERIMESATHKAPVCGTTHMFWTEG
jgi:hypothetical protein